MSKLSDSEFVLAVFIAHLAEFGLERASVDFKEFCASKEISQHSELLLEVVIWLRDEGVIRGTVSSDTFFGSLTSYGFNCLGQRLLGQDHTVGQAVKKVSAGEAQYVKLGGLLGGILGGFTKSIS